MIDLIATAKCSLLDNMFLGMFLLPMMPTVVGVTAFVVAHGLGRSAAHVLANRPIRTDAMWSIARLMLAVIAATLVVMVALRCLIYPVFLARMVKDAYYCSYFEAGRDLHAVHWIVFGLMFLAHAFCVVVFDDHRFQRLDSTSLKVASVVSYVVLGVVGYLMAISLDATLVPLTILFILPFAYCGIGILARQR